MSSPDPTSADTTADPTSADTTADPGSADTTADPGSAGTTADPASAGTTGERPAAAQRPLRAHAQRNRDKLIAAARAAFTAADDTVPLENLARDAGVGIGTLYRHFPTREALVEAVYAAELDDIATSAPALLEQHPPQVALRAWMDRYAAFAAMKRGMADALRAGQASGRIPTSTTRDRLTTAITTILAKGADTGALRADVDPDDVTTMLLGIFLATAARDTPEQTGRLLDLLIDALQPKPGG
ncbi:TetR/AcrR family transcriptional regulator [Nonomuraea sp. NPDC050643]|uniref:TetR/AcrR family transcriptional regulator n=1 Tax=Nonomuraea sp. NPDC050643 TaxID=3155660 RepID=UPI003404837C